MNLHLHYLQYLWNLINVFFFCTSFVHLFASSWDLFYTFFCILFMSRVSENDFAKQWKIIECSNFIKCSSTDTLNPWRRMRPKNELDKKKQQQQRYKARTQQKRMKKKKETTANRTWETLVVYRDIETTLW